MKTIFAIVGETGSGKDTILNEVLKDEFIKYNVTKIVSKTNRPKRDSETNCIEHIFLSKEEFEKDKVESGDNILAYTKIGDNGYEYMATYDQLTDYNFYIIDPNGIKSIVNKKFNDISIIPFYIDCPKNIRRARLKSTRSDFDTEFEKRCANEEAQFEEFKNKDGCAILLDNESIDALDDNVDYICQVVKTRIMTDFIIANNK